MQRLQQPLIRASRALRTGHVQQQMQVRHGSGGVSWYSERWARIVRSQSNIDTTEDPPTAPLPESHEAGEGNSDFSNWVNKHEDTSWEQVLVGLGILGGTLGTITYLALRDRRTKTPTFELRELPNLEVDFPTLAVPVKK